MDRMCPSCHKMVKVTAAVCPGCSWNFSRKTASPQASPSRAMRQLTNPMGRWWLLPVGAVALIVIANWSPGNRAAEAVAPEVAMPVTVGELERSFDGNEVAAMQRYGKRLLAITGKVSKVALDSDDEPFISFESEGLIPFQAKLGTDASDAAARIAVGDELTVYCRDVTEALGQPFGDDCSL